MNNVPRLGVLLYTSGGLVGSAFCLPLKSVQQLFTAAGVDIPLAVPYSGAKVYTKKKLPEERQHQ